MPATCTSSSEPDSDHVLTGSFVWLESHGGFAGLQRSPASEGYTVRLEYQGDRVRAFRDDRLVGEARFTVRVDSAAASPQPAYLVSYSPALTVFRFATLDGHSAVLADGGFRFDEGCCDRYVHLFAHR